MARRRHRQPGGGVRPRHCSSSAAASATAGDLLLGPARAAFARHLTGRGYRPEARIVAAELGNDAGLIGAADLARVAANGEQGG